jgi:hypothetical protein
MENVRLLTEREAARVLSIAEITLRNWRRNGLGPAHVQLGRCIRYTVNALQDYVDGHLSV